ncbi:SseB family protein [Lentzea sp. NBRC 102530]|uniref:SseB family protein n=1 Tax=Lentzea sp. NBRC 102530 TaxID=3032201 RepID=UPI002557A821|nr:SseB family protein [Lentzea sp. NBRC 102530]
MPATDHQTELAVVREVHAFYAGHGDPHRLLAAFRETPVHVCRQVSPPAVITVEVPGMGQWLQVFTTVEHLTSVTGADSEYMTLLGSEVLDLLLPVLPEGLGVILDPHTAHMMTFPPVEPIVTTTHAKVLPFPGGERT